jgi:predicted amidohydrolase
MMRLVLMQPQLRAFDDAYNAELIERLLDPFRGTLDDDDVILLPEHVRFDGDADAYRAYVTALAVSMQCHVVGGSYHEQRGAVRVNTGITVAPDGDVVARHEKLRPYADERTRVEPGVDHGCVMIAGRRVLVRVCADFWFSDLFLSADELPDLVLVPALSVTRKATPDYSRDLWRHLAVARAYEFGVYAGISDWGHPSELPRLMTSGVGGLADPTGLDPLAMFEPIGDGIRLYTLDFTALEEFRHDRRERGFFWK